MENLYLENIAAVKNNSGKVGLFEYFFVLVLIIYVGNANMLVLVSTWREDFGIYFFPALISGILALKYRVAFNKNFYLLILGLFIYFFLMILKYKEIYPTLFLDYFLKFFVAYVAVKALGYSLFRIYEYLIYLLAIIAIFLWIIQIGLGGDTLYYFLSKIPSIETFSHVTGNGFNVIFYSVQPTLSGVLYDYFPPRNCGFAWEPGGFAVYLCLAIFINLFISKDDTKRKTRFIALLLALISTQSTTGFFILMIILVFYYLNKEAKTIFLVLPVLTIVVIMVFSLPFMSNKIVSLITEINEVDITVEAGYGREVSITPQRFTSFVIAIQDFYLNPFLGTGGIKGKSWTARIGVNISTITGIGNLLAQFGIVGFLFFMITSLKTSIKYSEYFNFKGKLLFFLIILSISVSYGILFMPLIISFWIFSLFRSSELKEPEDEKRDVQL